MEEEAETKEEPLDPGDAAELEDEAARYHHDDDWDGIMFSTEEKGDEGKVEAALPLDKGGWVEAKLVELEDMIKQLHVGVRPPLTDEGIVPPVQRGPRPTPTPSIIAGLDPPPPPPPVESLFSPQPPPYLEARERKTLVTSPLQRAVREGREQGDLMEGFQAYPVLQPPGQQQRQYYAIPWKQFPENCLCSVWSFRSFYTYCFGDHGS